MTNLCFFTYARPGVQRLFGLGVLCYVLALTSVSAADPKAEKPAQKTEKKTQYSGAELYAMHCNRCHPERYATERTSGQWKTLLLHMRIRANLPATQAKAIIKFLQEDSGK
jgi:hypothetical protein